MVATRLSDTIDTLSSVPDNVVNLRLITITQVFYTFNVLILRIHSQLISYSHFMPQQHQ